MSAKILLGSVVALVFVAQAQAAERKRPVHHAEMATAPASHASQNMAGCGLGSMLVGENSKWSQVGAAFLNGTGMQTFGISFGTSNCTEDGMATASREKDAFVEANIADIRRDLSVGSGEYLASLSSFYGCKGEQVPAFNRALRKHQNDVQGASAEQASRVIDSAVSEEHAACRIQG
jgi:hypothetical protein